MFLLYKQKIKDWRFLYKLLSCIFIFILSILTIIFSVFTEFWYVNSTNKDNFYNSIVLQNFDIMLSFWSSQTIFIVNIWFLFSLIYHQKEQTNRFTNIYSQINLTIYITITVLIFWVGIFIDSVSKLDLELNWFWKLNNLSLFCSFLDHLVSPILMITFLILTFKKNKFNINIKKQFILVVIYPIIYLTYIYIRASILQTNDVKNFIYPYNILNFNYSIIGIPLWINSILVIILIISTIISTTLFYLWINKFYYKTIKEQIIMRIK
ncbi:MULTISPECIES: hypothetical protein [unclassified Spiroplasma]|uniref:hypothetical protein n=1 Tax=unclassified Spiroplasma TaxID=2637901 RepID=UPI0030D48936